ncbi:MAG: Ig-like domain-containing protein, partial [Sulfuritalea sp.]|nr:Ig-like domain-containing protein [Sulfuritalea sp.]
MPSSTVFYVKNQNNELVPAKFLQLPVSGAYVQDPHYIDINPVNSRNGHYYDAAGLELLNFNPNNFLVVPVNFNFQAALDFGTSLQGKSASVVSFAMTDAFTSRLGFDGIYNLQKSYQTVSGMNVSGADVSHVPMFQDATSYVLGAVAAKNGTVDNAIIGGGLYNQILGGGNTSGAYGNNPRNVESIKAGAELFGAYVPPKTAVTWTPSTAPLTYADSQTVLIKQGDTLSKIAADQSKVGNAITSDDLMKINGLAPGQELNLQIGQQILVPQKVNGNLVVDYGDVRLSMNPTDGTYQYLINDPQANTTTLITRSLDSAQASGYSDHYVKTDNASGLELESFVNGVDSSYGYQFDNGQSTTQSFTSGSNTTGDTQQTDATDPTTAPNADNSTLYDDGTYSIGGVGDVNTATGNEQAANAILSNDFQPGANNVLHFDDWGIGIEVEPELYFDDWGVGVGAYTNQQAAGATQWTPVDPLILDLNGDGVKLTSFADAPVLFDIDHDGGSKEVTGWVSKEDGIVVMDLNGNGRIDGISETMSEYFNGTVGSNGDAGTKPYANGFAALKSLDSNADNQFTALDSAWTNVKVWQDANHDGLTDAGELKTLDELGITSINLTPTTQSGLVNGGNEVLATGTFVQDGITKEAQAARFIANPTGNTATVTATGTTVAAQDGQSTYVSSVTTGETIDVAALSVKNAYGNTGNDTLIGDAGANWLVGGQGSDTFNAGAGDDMLLIDAADLQQNIQAGAGFDMVQVIGQEGVTLNLAQAEVEVAIGGTGNDILIGGGRSSVFIRAGDGDDIVIGGAANDALSGENGDDLIDGGAGNDVIRGGRGRDQLMGGSGDDLIEGGLDDDRLSGGSGNDVLKGGQGDDVIDGGDGIDVAQFAGSFADYRITKLTDTSYRVVDTKAGRDGADMLTNVEKLSFADVSGVDITLDSPMPVKDVITIADRVGTKLIKVADLLANDRDWQGDLLHITTISDLKGGTLVGSYNATTQEWTPTLTANGELQFTPDPAYTGVMSFKYKLADADNTPGATAYIAGTQIAAELRGQVFLKTPDMPTDGLFTDQWYLNDINVLPVWQDAYGQGYTGKGIKIAQFEPGMPFSTGPEVFDYRHPDLQANVDAAWISDPDLAIPQSFSQHATLVAGVMTAARNGEGAVGVAYDAKLSGHYIQGTGLEIAAMEAEVTAALAQFKNYDVVNNSWGSTADFDINVVPVGTLQQGLLDAVTQGRGGLGTAVVMAGGNDRQNGGNTNANALTANRAVIVTGAINAQADISTLTIGQAPFSNPGASILVSAPGSNVAS